MAAGSNPVGLIFHLDTFLSLFIITWFFNLTQTHLGSKVGKTIHRHYHKVEEELDPYERTFLQQDHPPFLFLDIGEDSLSLEVRILIEVTHGKIFKENQYPEKGEGIKFHYPLSTKLKTMIVKKHEHRYRFKLKRELGYIELKDK